MKFNEKLKILREKNNLSQQGLADELRISRSLVARWEHGDIFPAESHLERLSSIFKITMDSLTSEDEELESVYVHKVKEDMFGRTASLVLFLLTILVTVIGPFIALIELFSLGTFLFPGNTFNYTVISRNPDYQYHWVTITLFVINMLTVILSAVTIFIKGQKLRKRLMINNIVGLVLSFSLFIIILFL